MVIFVHWTENPEAGVQLPVSPQIKESLVEHKVDFTIYINEVYYEIKGAHYNKWEYKKEQFPKDKILIIIDGKKAIKPYLKYVEEKYGKKFWEILYEDKKDIKHYGS